MIEINTFSIVYNSDFWEIAYVPVNKWAVK